jgi:hypothetical protein
MGGVFWAKKRAGSRPTLFRKGGNAKFQAAVYNTAIRTAQADPAEVSG